jgi:hypothetical protein
VLDNKTLRRLGQRHYGGRYVPRWPLDLVAVVGLAMLDMRQRERYPASRGKREPERMPQTIIRVTRGGKIKATRKR